MPYTFGTAGSNSCPTGYTFITTIAECKHAAALLAPGDWRPGYKAGANYGTANPKGVAKTLPG